MATRGVSILVCISLACANGCDSGQQAAKPVSSTDKIKKELGLPSWALPPLRTATLRIGDVTAKVELAFTAEEQAQGLMYRSWMPEDHGMLFVYREPEFLSFWMKNTSIPLSIAFIRPDGTIDVIREMKPLDTSLRYYSRHKCQFALEMNQSWFSRHKVQPGDRVELPEEVIEFLGLKKPVGEETPAQ